MFSQTSKGLLNKAFAYVVRLLYHKPKDKKGLHKPIILLLTSLSLAKLAGATDRTDKSRISGCICRGCRCITSVAKLRTATIFGKKARFQTLL